MEIGKIYGSNATCILFVAIVKLQCSHPVLHSKTSFNTSRPYLSVYMRLKPPPGWGACRVYLQSAIATELSWLEPLPGWGACRVYLQSAIATELLCSDPLMGGGPAECICNLQLQLSCFLLRSPLGRRACRVYLQSAIATELFLLRSPLGRRACRVYLQSAIATE